MSLRRSETGEEGVEGGVGLDEDVETHQILIDGVAELREIDEESRRIGRVRWNVAIGEEDGIVRDVGPS